MSSAEADAAAPVARSDWGAPPALYPARARAALIALVSLPALSVALVVAVFTGRWWLGALLLVLWGAKTLMEIKTSDRLMLRRLGASRLPAEAEPRLRNIASGLAKDLGVAPPEVYLIQDGGPNALVHAARRGGLIAVTRSLLDSFTRTELEAVVAHCLVRIQSRDFLYSNLAARWSDLGAGLAPRVGTTADIRAAAVTRYPPGLASALRKSDGKVKRYAPLWFAAEAPSHDVTAARAAAVADL